MQKCYHQTVLKSHTTDPDKHKNSFELARLALPIHPQHYTLFSTEVKNNDILVRLYLNYNYNHKSAVPEATRLRMNLTNADFRYSW